MLYFLMSLLAKVQYYFYNVDFFVFAYVKKYRD